MEDVLKELEKLEKQHGEEKLNTAYQFRASSIGSEEFETLKELVEQDNLESVIHSSTYAGSTIRLNDPKIAEKLEKAGYLKKFDEKRYCLTRKAFELFPQ
ncbi:MAG: hypothetical protein ABIE55_03325 [Candidatus Aenigmatarchaeota archaeon]